MIACAAGHTECVRVLLKAGADPFKGVLVPDTRRGRQGLRTKDVEACICTHSTTAIVSGEVVGLLRETPQYVTSRFAVQGVMQGTPPSSPDQPKSRRAKPTKPQRTTPMRKRADKAGVRDKIQASSGCSRAHCCRPRLIITCEAGQTAIACCLEGQSSNCYTSRTTTAAECRREAQIADPADAKRKRSKR